MTEAHLFAVFEWNALVFVDPVGQHVEEQEFVAYASQDVETTRVERHIRGSLAWAKSIRHKEALLSIVPQHDARGRAGDNELLAQADIHAQDWLMVERTEQILARFVFSSLLLKVDLNELVVSISEDQSVL